MNSLMFFSSFFSFLFFFPLKDLTFFIFQYVVWKVSKNAFKEYSEKEEAFVLWDTLFFPTGLLFCSALLFLPKREWNKEKLSGIKDYRVHIALLCTFEAISEKSNGRVEGQWWYQQQKVSSFLNNQTALGLFRKAELITCHKSVQLTHVSFSYTGYDQSPMKMKYEEKIHSENANHHSARNFTHYSSQIS